MTEGQLKLKEAHGTPMEYAAAVWRAVPAFISVAEAQAAVEKYFAEWEAA